MEAFEEFALRAKLPALVLSKSESGKCIDSQHDLGNGVSHSYGTTDSASAHNIGTAERGAVRAQGAFDERSVQIERHKAPAHLQLPKLVVVEDIPHVSNAEQRRRLAAAIGKFVRRHTLPRMACWFRSVWLFVFVLTSTPIVCMVSAPSCLAAASQ